MEEKSTSVRFALNSIDWKKIGIGAGVAVAGALMTYLTPVVTGLDMGQWTPLVVVVWSVLANIVRKFVSDYSSYSE